METPNKVVRLGNGQLTALVSSHCDIICDTIAILYEGVLGKWLKVSSGVAALEGNKKDSRLDICFYSLAERSKVFDITLYGEMNYTVSGFQFHTFSDEKGSYGLSFSDANDAQRFYKHVNRFLKSIFLNNDKLSDEAAFKVGQADRKIRRLHVRKNGPKKVHRRKDKKPNVDIQVHTFKLVGKIGLTESGAFEALADNEELANELLKALALTVNDKKEMELVKKTIARFGPNQVKEAIDQKQRRRLAPLPDEPISEPSEESRHYELFDSIDDFNPNNLKKVNTAGRSESGPELLEVLDDALKKMFDQRRAYLTESDTDEGSSW